jgi:hypothetical protein
MKTQLLKALVVVIMLLLPTLNFGQAPPLGTAANFVLFTSVGAVTNSGIPYLTNLTGNVGSNSAPTITGFGNIDGQMHYVSDPVSLQCAVDLQLAYSFLQAAIPDSTIGIVIGNGDTLKAGTYMMPGVASLNLNLTLNGEGNSNSVFIFKTTLAFSTSANAKVRLINGAKACNVFWCIGGAVNLGTGTTMKGTIISGGAISLGVGDTLEGRALSVSGAILTSQVRGYIPGGCGSPVLNGPAAPPLASAAGYAVFSSIGSVTDDGTSHINGDVGTNSGSTTGYNPLFVTGMIHPSPDPSTAACAADLTIAYNYLNLLAYDINLLFPAQFGHNLVLTPHTYLLDAATLLTDTVYLNALGNANAVFIIQINGALSTTAHSKVALMNGAQAKNVYWKVNGAVNIMDFSVFKGTIVATGAITFGTGASLEGRALTINGAITTTGLTASTPAATFSEPSNQTVCAGGSASFTVTISAAAPTYQWRRGTVNLINGGNISGATTATLTINPVAMTDAATNYNVVIAGSVVPGDTSINVSLTVNPLPVPTITGPASVLVNSVGNIYTTQTGMTGYAWTVSAGGIITAGSTSNAITVTWNTIGANTVTVNYVNSNTCTAATPTVYNVTVTPLVPIITGSASVCQGITGVVYTTEAGKTGYAWTITSGGTITSGSGSNSIIVTWNNTGNQSVGVTYANSSATLHAVTVNALPVPTITGPASVLVNSVGHIYTTQPGMTGYTWTVSTGGIITAGSTSNAITVTWNIIGANTVTVNYVNSNTCTAATPTVYNVTVTPLVPTITGSASVCQGITGVVYTTEGGKTGYVWTITSGGTITSGSGSNSIMVTWNSTGNQSVGVTYANSSATLYAVTVNALPVPTITGVGTVCQGASGLYTTQAGMTGYIWTISAGGTITAGGTSTSNTVTVNWTTIGAKTVMVNYTNINGCTAPQPGSLGVTVNATPVPTIGSTNNPCVGSTNNIYYTENGMSGYLWTVSAGGTIVSGQGTSTVDVTWTQLGTQTVGVNYVNASGCPATLPGVYSVFVNAPPNAANGINGTASICAGASGIAYSTTPIVGTTSYSWTVPAGATIASGAGTTGITVDFGATAISGNVTVAGTNQCGNGIASILAVTVNPMPSVAGTINGSASVCAGETGVAYSVGTIANATAYVWSVPAGAIITSGASTKNIVVTFGQYAGTGVITVKGTNNCGTGTVSPGFNVIIHDIPANPVVTVAGNVLTSSSITGNQWYYNTILIPGATNQTYTVTNNTGNYWCVVTLDGCPSGISNKIWVEVVGTDELPASSYFTIYPVPNNGQFTASISYPIDDTFAITVYNQIGGIVFELLDVKIVGGKFDTRIDLRPVPNGMYLVVFKNSQFKIIRKFFVNN